MSLFLCRQAHHHGSFPVTMDTSVAIFDALFLPVVLLGKAPIRSSTFLGHFKPSLSSSTADSCDYGSLQSKLVLLLLLLLIFRNILVRFYFIASWYNKTCKCWVGYILVWVQCQTNSFGMCAITYLTVDAHHNICKTVLCLTSKFCILVHNYKLNFEWKANSLTSSRSSDPT